MEPTHKTSSGEIICLEVFGDELTIVNCARVSFGVEKTALDERDQKLLTYLVRHQHFSPFRHVFLRFKITAPEFVLRQWFKHVVGAEWTSAHPTQLHGWNEISGRYIINDEVHTPTVWRRQSTDNKQGSDGELDAEAQEECTALYQTCCETISETYRKLIEKGVAKEQARSLLPLSTQTKVIWTCSLQAAIHFVRLRSDPHAQLEIREFSDIIGGMLKERFPYTWEAFEMQS
jgi:thymidylate synthase (FAD)